MAHHLPATYGVSVIKFSHIVIPVRHAIPCQELPHFFLGETHQIGKHAAVNAKPRKPFFLRTKPLFSVVMEILPLLPAPVQTETDHE